MKNYLLLVTFILISLPGCDYIKSKFGKKTETADTTTSAQNAPKALCSEGAKIEIIKGTCSGKWAVVQKDDFKICEFTFDEEKSCPSDMLSLDGQISCVGSYRKKIGVAQDITTPEQCAEAFGAAPKAAEFALSCCAK